jgi:hypothetical protein
VTLDDDLLRETEAMIEEIGDSQDHGELIAKLEEIDARIKELLAQIRKEAEGAQP